MNKFLVLILSFQLTCLTVFAQNTVGLLSYNPSLAYDGYNLIFPHNQPDVFLIDNCGEIVHTWEGEVDFRPGNVAYLLEDGQLVKAIRPASVAGDPIWAGGGGATIEIRDWNNNLEWSYTLNNDSLRLHHDIAIIDTDEGFNILAIAWELKTIEEAVAAGRDTSQFPLPANEIWPDYLFEINPANDEIVWEWHAWDHLIQDADPDNANFGELKENPHRININYHEDTTYKADWMHSNALDYDPVNDMILLCVPAFHEVFMIDHTTTTAEAASSTGGFSGRGGDLLFRWGNPANYNRGDSTDQKLFYPHDAHFNDDFVDPLDPNRNSIAIFNNRVGSDFSTVNFFVPKFDMYDWEFRLEDGKFLPSDFSLNKKHPIDSTLMYSTGLSSVQLLPNTNLLVCVGRFGYGFEMTQDNEIVWEYKVPRIGPNPATQGDSLEINNNLTFRMTRYPTDFEAFDGRDLSQKGWMELEPDINFCDIILPTSESFISIDIKMYPNPVDNMLTIEWEAGKYIDMEIFNLLGQKIVPKMRLTGGKKYIDAAQFDEGIYVVAINGNQAGKFIVIR